MAGGPIHVENVEKGLEALALYALSFQLARTTYSLSLFTGSAFGRLFVGTAQLHFTEDALALHLLLQDLQGLIDVIVTNRDLHVSLYLIILSHMGDKAHGNVPKKKASNIPIPGCEGPFRLSNGLICGIFNENTDYGMSILRIARMGHPVLMGKARAVKDPTSTSVHKLVSDMVDTMLDAPGIGLAAPQVHVPARVVVFRVPEERTESGDGVPLTFLINPEIEPVGDEKEEGIEGCLSLPEMIGLVPRYTKIRYRAFDLTGQRFEVEAEGYHARVVQHECDHLDGILYPMRMTDLSKLGYAEDMSKNYQASYCEFSEGEVDDADDY